LDIGTILEAGTFQIWNYKITTEQDENYLWLSFPTKKYNGAGSMNERVALYKL